MRLCLRDSGPRRRQKQMRSMQGRPLGCSRRAKNQQCGLIAFRHTISGRITEKCPNDARGLLNLRWTCISEFDIAGDGLRRCRKIRIDWPGIGVPRGVELARHALIRDARGGTLRPSADGLRSFNYDGVRNIAACAKPRIRSQITRYAWGCLYSSWF